MDIAQARLRRSQLVSLDCLRVPDSTDFQRELRALVLLSEDHRNLHSGPCPPDLWQVVRLTDIEVSDENHQERLDLHETTQRVILSVLG